MSGRSHGYLGIISTFFGVNVSCSRTQHGTPSEDRTPTLSLTTKPITFFEVLFIFMTMRMRFIYFYIGSLDERADQIVSMVILIVF